MDIDRGVKLVKEKQDDADDADDQCSCVVVIRGKPVNLGGREGMSVPCKLEFSGKKDFIDILKSQISKS